MVPRGVLTPVTGCRALTDLAVHHGKAGRAPQALSAIARIDDRNMKAHALGALAAVLTSGDATTLTACP